MRKLAASLLLISAVSVSFFGFLAMSHSQHAHPMGMEKAHSGSAISIAAESTQTETPCLAAATTGKKCQHETPLNALAYHIKALKDFSLADVINLTIIGFFLLLAGIAVSQIFHLLIKALCQNLKKIAREKLYFKNILSAVHTNIFETNTRNWLSLGRIAAA